MAISSVLRMTITQHHSALPAPGITLSFYDPLNKGAASLLTNRLARRFLQRVSASGSLEHTPPEYRCFPSRYGIVSENCRC